MSRRLSRQYDLLRGDYKQSEYGRVILPFTVLRQLDCVLESTKPAVLTELAKRTQAKLNPEAIVSCADKSKSTPHEDPTFQFSLR